MSPRPFADLTDMTLADEDTNSILTDNANRTFQGNVSTKFPSFGDNLQPYRYQGPPETQRSSWTHRTAGLVPDLFGKAELRMEWRRAH